MPESQPSARAPRGRRAAALTKAGTRNIQAPSHQSTRGYARAPTRPAAISSGKRTRGPDRTSRRSVDLAGSARRSSLSLGSITVSLASARLALSRIGSLGSPSAAPRHADPARESRPARRLPCSLGSPSAAPRHPTAAARQGSLTLARFPISARLACGSSPGRTPHRVTVCRPSRPLRNHGPGARPAPSAGRRRGSWPRWRDDRSPRAGWSPRADPGPRSRRRRAGRGRAAAPRCPR